MNESAEMSRVEVACLNHVCAMSFVCRLVKGRRAAAPPGIDPRFRALIPTLLALKSSRNREK
jgi:hypothetical protein